MSRYYVQPYVRDTDAEPSYTFAEIKWGKIVAIHRHWLPLEEFYKFFEAGAFFIDVTGVLIDGEEPRVGDVVTNDPVVGYKIVRTKSPDSDWETIRTKIEQLKLTRDRKEQEPVEYHETLFDADEISLNRMDKARKFLEDNNIPSITWTTAENTRMDVDVEDFKALNTLIAMRSNDLHVRYNQLKQYIYDLNLAYIRLVPLINWEWDVEQDLNERYFQEFGEEAPELIFPEEEAEEPNQQE